MIEFVPPPSVTVRVTLYVPTVGTLNVAADPPDVTAPPPSILHAKVAPGCAVPVKVVPIVRPIGSGSELKLAVGAGMLSTCTVALSEPVNPPLTAVAVTV